MMTAVTVYGNVLSSCGGTILFSPFASLGAIVTIDNTYVTYTFLRSGVIVIPNNVFVDVLLVGGGGSGGDGTVGTRPYGESGGGGGGQVLEYINTSISAGLYNVNIGGSDQNSSFATLTALAGNGSSQPAQSCASAGGNSGSGQLGGSPNGGGSNLAAGGGGGNSAPGQSGGRLDGGGSGGNGGAGTLSVITGNRYGGGGGGAGYAYAGLGVDGGGNGGTHMSLGQFGGTPNTGGGGGGSAYEFGQRCAGGSGICVIRYRYA